jgi:hypothetical protein
MKIIGKPDKDGRVRVRMSTRVVHMGIPIIEKTDDGNFQYFNPIKEYCSVTGEVFREELVEGLKFGFNMP